jgi:hypothetical protein
MDLAAATAAPRRITLGDKQYTFSRLTLRDWGELEQAAMESYRREFLTIRLANADLMAPGDVVQYRQSVIEQALLLTSDDMPHKRLQTTGKDVEYAVWWFHDTLQGRLHAIWLSMRKNHPDLTLEQLDNALMDEFVRAGLSSESLASMVGEMSVPSVGNSPAPQTAAQSMTTEQLGQALSGRRARRIRQRRRQSPS